MRQVRDRKGLLMAILIILALTAGAGLGLLIGWVIAPVKYVDTAIADLHPEYKDEYILLVASAYALDHDLEEAQARLDKLEVPNIKQWIAQLADRYIAEGQDEADIRVIVELAHGLGVDSPQMAAYLATPTPTLTDTPSPTLPPTPTDTLPPPTNTSIPPTEAPTSMPPSDTPPQPTDTSPPPTDTPIPPTDTPKPQPTNTPKPQPTNTPIPPTATSTPKPQAATWTYTARLVGPGEDAQTCESGNLQIRVMVLDANGNQINGVWIYDKYSQQYQVTGNVDSPDWGPGETKFEYGGGGGGSLCIASGQGGTCASDYTRDMPCYNPPPFEDLWSAGYCACCEPGITKEECREYYDSGAWCMAWRHYSWRVVFKRSQ